MTLSQRTFVAMPDHDGDNGGNVLVLDPDAAELNARDLELRLDLFNHSPTGFAWGYLGSGPAQLALAILADCFDDKIALDYHHPFKDQVIQHKTGGTWSISEEYVRGWLKGHVGDMNKLVEQIPEVDIINGEDWDTPDHAPHNGEPAEIVAGGEDLDPMLVLELVRNGYSDLRLVPGRGVCGILRFMYTCGVCYGMDATGREGRFCFDTMQNAQLFLHDWDGTTEPTVGLDGCTAIK